MNQPKSNELELIQNQESEPRVNPTFFSIFPKSFPGIFPKFFRRIRLNEHGQGITEYLLLLMIVIAVVFIFKDKIREAVKGKVDELGGQITNFKGDQ